MISIVICSRTIDISQSLKINIQETIGLNYEIIVINNSQNNYSIFSAYNLGVKQCNNEIICFMHDDVHFETLNWGNIVINQFQKENIGAVGVAGTPYYAKMPGAWWSGGMICQHISGQTDYAYAPIKNNALPIVVLDGLWFCIKKELFKTISFDEKNFSGFHFYDVDISLQIKNLGFEILSLYNITISHSSGKLDSVWLKNALILNKKWEKHLPLSVINITYKQEVKIEYLVLSEYLKAMHLNGIKWFKIIQFALVQILKNRLNRLRFETPFVFILYGLRQIMKIVGLKKLLRNFVI